MSLQVSGYEVGAAVHIGPSAVVYRARRVRDGAEVAMKLPRSPHPTLGEVAQLRREFELYSTLQLSGLPRPYAMETVGQRPCLVLEYIGGGSLADRLRRDERLGIAEFLRLSQELVGILATLHERRLMHGDIKPDNVMLDPAGRPRLIDLGSSCRLSREGRCESESRGLRGTLAYLAPEGSGRLQRQVDRRADFYALGVTFYELLAGSRPFCFEDPLDLLHAQLALEAPPLRELRPEVPRALSAIVQKLMSKDPEGRYRGARGLLADLHFCLEYLGDPEALAGFEPGRSDVSEIFLMPQRTYGREAELAALLDAAEQVAGGAVRLVLVEGRAGVGKSALLRELRAAVAARDVLVGAGKFHSADSAPYSAVVEALDEVLTQLLGQRAEQVSALREQTARAVAPNGRVLTDVLPRLERLLGPQPEVPALPPWEGEIRFGIAFRELLRVLRRDERPLVLLLEDLQWADPASLRLLSVLLSEPGASDLLVVATRRGGGDPDSLEEVLTAAGRSLLRIQLEPLGADSIALLLADALRAEVETTRALAGVLHARTGGNPLFIHQVLSHLHATGGLHFDPSGQSWKIALDELEGMRITGSLLDLLRARLHALEEGARRVLLLAAVLGYRFERDELARAAELSEAQVDERLVAPLDEGLIVGIDEPDAPRSFRFLQEELRGAALALVGEEALAALRLAVGRRLLAALPPGRRAAQLFTLLGYFDGADLTALEPGERDLLLELYQRAAHRAYESSAFRAGFRCAERALELLGEEPWAADAERAYTLSLVAARAAVRCGERERLLELTEDILQRCTDPLARLPAYEARIDLDRSTNARLAQAARTGREALEMLGISLPGKAGLGHLAAGVLKTRWLLRGRSPEDLAALPPLDAPAVEATLRLMTSLTGAFYAADPLAFPLLAFEAIRLSLRHGNCALSGWAYNLYGVILASMGDIEGGVSMGRAGLEVFARYGAPRMRAQLSAEHHLTLSHWEQPIRATLPALDRGVEDALAVGDLTYAGTTRAFGAVHRFYAGEPLAALCPELEALVTYLEEIRQPQVVAVVRVYHQHALFLTGSDDSLLEHSLVDQPALEAVGNQTAIFMLHLCRAVEALMALDGPAGRAALERARGFASSAVPTVAWSQLFFYEPLLLLLDAAGAPVGERRRRLRAARKALGKLRRWTGHCWERFGHQAALVAAEVARVEGRVGEAAPLYEQAIEGARRAGLIHEAALAGELAGRFQRALGAAAAARSYLQDACYDYLVWGAGAKVEAMEEQYAALGPLAMRQLEASALAAGMPGSGHTTWGTMSLEGVDMISLLRASQVLSGEIEIDQLLARIMDLALHNAGAERGVLMLQRGGRLDVAACTSEGGRGFALVEAIPVQDYGGVPVSVVNSAVRSREPVVLRDAASDARFCADPYIARARPRSVLCAPLITRQELLGALYLENNLTDGAFTAERLHVVSVLSTQAAISYRNARLYAEQVQLTAAYSRFVPRELLTLLGCRSIVDVQLGDQVQRYMAVLFLDIRRFTSLSERLSPAESFSFINEFLGAISPVIRHSGGFIDKYIGDAIMALFSGGAADAVAAAVEINRVLGGLNRARSERGLEPVQIGIGIHAGTLTLGTVGEAERMDGTVISDTVNIASRLEDLTKRYRARILVSREALEAAGELPWPARPLGEVQLRGKRSRLEVVEVLLPELHPEDWLKVRTIDGFHHGVGHMLAGRAPEAAAAFRAILSQNPEDGAAAALLARCEEAR